MATYYVRTSATDTSGDGTVDADSGADNHYAFKSLSRAGALNLNLTGAGPCTIICSSGSGTDADTTAVLFSGWTTTADDYVLIQAATGQRATADAWKTDRYRLSVTDAVPLDIRTQYARVDGLQIEVIGQTTGKTGLTIGGIAAGGSYYRFSHCRIRGSANDGVTGGNLIASGDADAVAGDIINCILYGNSAGSGTVDGVYITSNGTAGDWNLVNCTAFKLRRGIADVTGSKLDCYNCVSCNVTGAGDDFRGTFNAIDHCASDDGDGTNAIDISPAAEADGWAAAFLDYANGDFRVKDTSSVLYNAGTDDPLGSGLGSPDIAGTTRSTWDVGAHEYAAAATSILPHLLRTQQIGLTSF